jgi:hypothetical protein
LNLLSLIKKLQDIGVRSKGVHPKTVCFRFWREAKNISRQNRLSLDTNFDDTVDRPNRPSLLNITSEMNSR